MWHGRYWSHRLQSCLSARWHHAIFRTSFDCIAPGRFEWNFRQKHFSLCYWLICIVKLPSDECHFHTGSGNGLVLLGSKQAITWTDDDSNICHHMASASQRVKITLCPDSHFAQTKAKLWHKNNKTDTIQIELYISWSCSLRDLRRLFDLLLFSTADLYLAIACCAVAWPRMVGYKSRTFFSMKVSAGPPNECKCSCNIMFSSISSFNFFT